MEPKTEERAYNFRKANRKMPRRRLDIPVEKIDHKNPEVLTLFTTDTGKILPRRVTGVSAKIHRKITREIKRSRALNLLK
ncbi:MAG TPA: 30S ribosomal protein S18 [Verrucomicrobia bacterium]|jgi:small subunit ribosomal protein S18|nr:30S ribosomal protein S18 [Verrucomicrobiales bacterium]HIL54275.1 30S ribosomal protein S18 [Verrucomicrobiota bacterium]|tara:strand:- start:725 stop:964 length:240 start_codon:yes stop_codon:yes gene_type:complete